MAQQADQYEHYKKVKLLGEGGFGEAYLVKCLSNGSLCVIKRIDLNGLSNEEKQKTLQEARILESFDHQNIIKFREVYKTKQGKLCIVMDYADGGDLRTNIKAQGDKFFSEDQILSWFAQICLALNHVHERKVIHRDVKCQNIFLTSNNMVKLGDFGIAKVLSTRKEQAETIIGTPHYMSPEIINGDLYSFESDIWSLGVVLYELCSLKAPFEANNLALLVTKIAKGEYEPLPSQFSKELRDLVESLLQVDRQKRPTILDVLKRPIIQNAIQKLQHQNQVEFEEGKNEHNEAIIRNNILQPQQQQQQAAQKERAKPENHNSENQNRDESDKQNPHLTDSRQAAQFDLANESMGLMGDISDYNDLECFRIKLEKLLGEEIFLQAYCVAKDLLQKHSRDIIQQQYGHEDGYASLFPFMSEEARRMDLEFVFEYVILEERLDQIDV